MSNDEEHKSHKEMETGGPEALRNGEIEPYDLRAAEHDAVFGDIHEDGPNYRNVGWLGTAALMVKSQIGLGVLSLPAVFDTFGMIPGVILLLTVGIITTWSDYIVGVFKLRHREIYSVADAGGVMFGRIGNEFYGAAYIIFFIFVGASGLLSVSISLNALSHHAICTAIFVVVAAIMVFIPTSIRTLDRISWLAWVGSTSIIVAILTVTIAVGLQERPSSAPQEGVWQSDYKLVASPTFNDAISAMGSIVFAWAGTPTFFQISSEMRNPADFNKSLILCQSIITVIYVVVGVVVYYYCGSYVASPALGSAGPTVKRVAYGLALPGLLASAILLLHLPAKQVFVRALRGSKHLTSNTPIHWATWLGSTFATVLAAYLVASGIPVFGQLVSLIGALLGTLLSFQTMGFMWLHDNWSEGKQNPTMKWWLMVAWSIFVIVSGSFLMVAGTYGSIQNIVDSYKVSGGSAAWSCADNSNST
ncbi:unnamed protein product [Clonostachys byssicola]|uniref:Amino acid transporter transmembrane domain-containing protein n=1 Tax=Clonostachys byssicola TaxID=160290 RepID=A0A9N9UT54_9HYPO|nr:unnamed protein product [Clonostachys byssicola]